MSFYVTLPSHSADIASEWGQATNSQSSFSINLKKSLNFPLDKYEVGLCEMYCKNFWSVELGTFVLERSTGHKLYEEKIFIYDGLSIAELCRFLTEKFSNVAIYSDPIKMENFLKQVPNPNTDEHHNILHGIKTNIDLFKISFISLGNSSLGIYVHENYNLRIEGFLARLLFQKADDLDHNGFLFGRKFARSIEEKLQKPENILQKQMIFQESPNKINIRGHFRAVKFFLSNSHISYIENMYVYTDIIEDVIVGEEYAKLLRIVPVKTGFDKMQFTEFTTPHYLPIENDRVDRINMTVRDHLGDKIRFVDIQSPVTYKLHFRIKK